MRSIASLASFAALFALAASNLGCQQMSKMTGPSIRGNYVLDYRELPGGKHVRAPEVVGMMNFSADMRNFNVYWTEDGKPVSIGSLSKYWFDGKTYTEECIYYIQNVPSAGGLKYSTAMERGASPITRQGDTWTWKMPLHEEPSVAFTKDGLTATRAGVFVDHWKKVD